MKKKSKGRLSWFRLNIDDFFEDERTRQLTTKQQAAWMMALAKSFRFAGKMPVNPSVFADQTGISTREAKELLGILSATGLIVLQGNAYVSPRMAKEHEIAQKSYGRFSGMGEKSAEKNGTANLKLVK